MRHSKNKIFRNTAGYRSNLFIGKLLFIKTAATHGIENCLSDFKVDLNYLFWRCWCYAAAPEMKCLWCNFHERWCFGMNVRLTVQCRAPERISVGDGWQWQFHPAELQTMLIVPWQYFLAPSPQITVFAMAVICIRDITLSKDYLDNDYVGAQQWLSQDWKTMKSQLAVFSAIRA